jgi:hypothetical protein
VVGETVSFESFKPLLAERKVEVKVDKKSERKSQQREREAKLSREELTFVLEYLKNLEQDDKVKRAYDWYKELYDKIQSSDLKDKSLSVVDFRFVVNYLSYVYSHYDTPERIAKEEADALRVCRKVLLHLAHARNKSKPEDYVERTLQKAIEFVRSKNKKVRSLTERANLAERAEPPQKTEQVKRRSKFRFRM